MYSVELSKLGFDLKGRFSGKIKTLCPKCSETRRKSKEPCALVDIDNGIYKCYNCDFKGVVRSDKMKYEKPKENEKLTEGKHDQIFEYFKKRGIDRSTVIAFGDAVGYTPKVFFPGAGMNKRAICFNYLLGGEHVRTKYKSRDKDFASDPGGMNVPYNINSALHENIDYVLITEGEEECMVWHQCGKTSVISAPNGANENLDWLDSVYDLIEDKKVYIAVDMDEPGVKLRNALSRRFDKDRTFIVNYPLKDANDTLREYGEEYMVHLFNSAQPVPVPEIAGIENYIDQIMGFRDHGYPQGVKSGHPETDKHVRIDRGDLIALTGVPASGKTTWLRWWLADIAMQNDWKFGIFTFENPPQLWITEMMECLMGCSIHLANDLQIERASSFISKHFAFFDITVDTSYDLENILNVARSMIRRKGVDAIVLDPWNYVTIPKGDSLTEDIGSALRTTKRFCVVDDVATICVAHPRKMDKDGNNYKVPTPYDIQGSNSWFNTPDVCLAVHRDYVDATAPVELYVQKMKYKFRGKLGSVMYNFDPACSRYKEVGSNVYETQLGSAQQAQIFEE